MVLTINGDLRTVHDVTTVAQLLDFLGVSHQTVAVMVNGAIIARERFADAGVKDADTVEIVRFVGGG